MKTLAAQHRRGRSPTNKVTFQKHDSEAQTVKEERKSDQSTGNQGFGACLMYTNTTTYSQATAEMALMKIENQVRVSSAGSLSDMNTVQGILGKETVEVLRDTGCSSVIVKKTLGPEEACTGRNRTMVIVDCTSRVLPEAKMSIDTPYYKDEVLALCLENPHVDLIVGNKPGASERTDPDKNWVPTQAVQTRAHSKRSVQSMTLKTPEIIGQGITPAQICRAPQGNPCLKKLMTMCDSNEIRGKASFFKKRKFSSPSVERGRILVQLIVPQQYRKMVMKLAHESIMAGHLATKRFVQEVLSEFFFGLETLVILKDFVSLAISANALYLKVKISRFR